MEFSPKGENGEIMNIGNSALIGLSYFDKNRKNISVNNLSETITILIDQNIHNKLPAFEYINTSNITSGLARTGFYLNGSNVSLHIQILPLFRSIAYLTLLKFGGNPLITDDFYETDLWDVFCPKGNYFFYG